MGIYIKSIQQLKDAIENFKSHCLSIEELQRIVLQTAQDVTAIEERSLYNQLLKAESEIELIIFTVDDEYEAVCKVLNAVEKEVANFYEE